jgi:hypothetical protein
LGGSLPAMRRTTIFGILATVALAACGQAAPQRSALPSVPESFDFPPASTTLVPADGSCVVTTSRGVFVNDVTETFDAATVLAAGDVIVAIDDVAVTNQSMLLAAMSGREPGSEIDLTFRRGAGEQTERVVLGAAPDDPGRAMIGVMVRNDFATTAAGDIPPGIVEPGRLIMAFDDGLYSVDIATNDWVLLPFGVPPSAVVQFDELLLAVAEDRRGVESLDRIEGYRLAAEDFFVVAPLGSLGRNLLFSIVEPDASDGIMSSGVVSADFDTNRIEWTRQPPAVDGTFPVPVIGFASPGGDVIAVTHRHESGRLHTLYDASGTPLGGWGSGGADLAPVDALLAGWLDGRRFVSVVPVDGGGFEARVTVPADPEEPAQRFLLQGVPDIVSVYAVTGTELLVVGSETQTLVFDLAAETFDTLTRNCGVQILGATR